MEQAASSRMAIKVVFPLCSSFFTLLLYNLDEVETCFAKHTDYNTFSPIKHLTEKNSFFLFLGSDSFRMCKIDLYRMSSLI